MKKNIRFFVAIVFWIFSIIVFQFCHRDENIEITAIPFTISVTSNIDSKIEFPDKFEAELEIYNVNNGTIQAFSMYFIRIDSITHRTESYLEVPIEKPFLIRISADIFGTQVSGYSDTITLARGFAQPFNLSIFLSTGILSLTTHNVNSIGSVSAICVCAVVDNGGKPVTQRGVVWSSAEVPSLTNNSGFTSDGQGLGWYNSFVTGLTPETSYYVRAYAVNTDTISYGAVLNFTTAATTGTVAIITSPITDITTNSATGGGNVTDDGGEIISSKGIVWSASGLPDIINNDGFTEDGPGVGEFTSADRKSVV